MKDKIPPFLQERLKMKFSSTKNFSDDIKQFMTDYATFYNWNISDIKLIFKVMKRGTTNLPICGYEKCNKYVRLNSNGILTKGCCIGHSNKIKMQEKYGVDNISQLESTVIKREQTCLEKYGVSNPMKLDIVKQKIKNHSLETYGTEYPMQSEEIKLKFKNTMMEKYGVCNISSLDSNKDKVRATNLKRYGASTFIHSKAADTTSINKKRIETNVKKYGCQNTFQIEKSIKNKLKNNQEKYGVDYVLQSKEYMEIRKQYFIDNYDVENPSQLPGHFEKFKSTSLLKYGTEHPMQNPTVLEKNQKSSFRRKEFEWKTGEISIVQGYEPIVLSELENQGYQFNEILTSPKDMPEILYKLDGKEHRYYPDIFIPKDNIIIEVKSEWSLNLQKEKNQAKFKAVKELGYDFRVEIR